MKTPLRFKCSSCNQWHEGVPGWSYPFPMAYFDVPDAERSERCYLSEDLCVVDDARFFVRGCIDLPIRGYSDVLVIGAWADIAEEDFFEYQDLLHVEERKTYGPYPGRLSAAIPTFENTEGLELNVVVNDHGIRPAFRFEARVHPLAIAQTDGLSMAQVQSFYSYFERLRARR